MTDSSALLANKQALSSDVLYNLKPSVVRCRSYRCSVPASNKSTFAPQDTVVAYIPCRRNCFLDTANSYMKFTVKNGDTNAVLNIDGTAASFIQRLDVYHGSNLLETIQNYDVLNSYISDFQLDYAKRYGLQTAYGCTADRIGTGIATGGTVSQTFCMPIVSGTVGCLNDKFLPLSLADDIRLEFTLNATAIAAVYSLTTTTVAWSITNFELELNILELSDEGMQMVSEVTPFTEPIYMHGTSYRHYSSTLATGSTGNQSFLVPARFASLKSLILCPRTSTTMSISNAYSISSRVNPNIESYYWRIGSLIVPQKAVILKSTTSGGYAECYMENLRAWHSINNPNYAGSINMPYFNVAETVDAACNVVIPATTTNSYKNAFAIAQELESISNRNDVILSGCNTLNMQIFFEYQSVNSATTASAYTLDFFAMYDHILVLDQHGLLSVKF